MFNTQSGGLVISRRQNFRSLTARQGSEHGPESHSQSHKNYPSKKRWPKKKKQQQKTAIVGPFQNRRSLKVLNWEGCLDILFSNTWQNPPKITSPHMQKLNSPVQGTGHKMYWHWGHTIRAADRSSVEAWWRGRLLNVFALRSSTLENSNTSPLPWFQTDFLMTPGLISTPTGWMWKV